MATDIAERIKKSWAENMKSAELSMVLSFACIVYCSLPLLKLILNKKTGQVVIWIAKGQFSTT